MGVELTFTPDYAGIARMAMPGGSVDIWAYSMAQSIQAIAKGLVPRQTGALADSLAVERIGPCNWQVIADVPYAAAVHEGAAAHEITAKNVKVLRFPSKAGKIVFTPRVNHPGNQPNPFLERAMLAALGTTL